MSFPDDPEEASSCANGLPQAEQHLTLASVLQMVVITAKRRRLDQSSTSLGRFIPVSTLRHEPGHAKGMQHSRCSETQHAGSSKAGQGPGDAAYGGALC